MRFLDCVNSYFWSIMKKSSVSRMQRFLYSLILCYVLERWIRTQHQILLGNDSWSGSKVHRSTESWTELIVSQWNSSGIFSEDSLDCSSSKKSKSSWTKWAIHQNNSELSSCRCSMTSNGEVKTMYCEFFTCVFIHKKISNRTLSFLGLGSERSGILLMKANRKKNGIESLNCCWSNSEKADTQFSEPRVHCLEERSKAKEVENYLYTSVPMVIRLKLFFAVQRSKHTEDSPLEAAFTDAPEPWPSLGNSPLCWAQVYGSARLLWLCKTAAH